MPLYNPSLPLLPDGPIVGTTDTQTLTNKNINVSDNTLTSTGAAAGDILIHDGTKFVKVAKPSDGFYLGSSGGTLGYYQISTAADPSTNGLRLSLESGVAVSTSDQTAKTTLYFTPYFSGAIALYISSAWTLKLTAQVSVALGTLTSDKNYDVFAYWTGSAVAIELLAWTNDSTRATALTTQDGVYVKTGATDRRYVGTIRTTSTTTTEDSAAKRFVWNGPEPWRQINRPLVSPAETANTWTYNSTTPQQANANTANKVEVVVGLTSTVKADLIAIGAHNAAQPIAGIGIDATNAFVSGQRNSTTRMNTPPGAQLGASYVGALTAGYHYVAWLECCSSAATADFTGDNGLTTLQPGLTAQVPG